MADDARALEVEFNSAVLYRELVTHFGYAGSAQQVLRFVRPLRVATRQTRATVRFETEPGQQAQVDFGQFAVWVADAEVTAHLFVFTLGYSRHTYTEAFPHERLGAVLEGHEHAFQHFGGVPAQVVVDIARPVMLQAGSRVGHESMCSGMPYREALRFVGVSERVAPQVGDDGGRHAGPWDNARSAA